MSAFRDKFCSLVQKLTLVGEGDDGYLFCCTQATSLGYVAVARRFLVNRPFDIVIFVIILETPNVFG